MRAPTKPDALLARRAAKEAARGRPEWFQQGDPNEWVFGVKVRGVVRDPLAEVYYDEDRGWRWLVRRGRDGLRAYDAGGVVNRLPWAVARCEEALGVH